MSIRATVSYCLANLFPRLAAEWHPRKNGALTPQMVTPKSGKKVWWICEKGHEWEAIISNRSRLNSGCPYCTGKLPIVGVNDLKTVNPELAREWHPTKNGDIKPTDVMSSSKKKYWWICKQGHEWEASLDCRKRGHGCPFCSGRNAIEGLTDLLSQRPDIASLWHPYKNGDLKPNAVTVASGKKYWWIGKCGHEWKTKVSTMCDKHGLEICPICSSQNRTSFPEQAIYYYLYNIFPDVASRYTYNRKEIDVYVPRLNIGIEYDGMRYHTNETEEKELKKDLYFLAKGIQIFRLKEHNKNNIYHDKCRVYYNPKNNYRQLNQAIRILFDLISNFSEFNFPRFDIDIDKDNSKILNLFLKKKKDNTFCID